MIMKKIQLLLLALCSFTFGFSQVQVCLGTDATVCQGQTVTITNCTSGSGSSGGGIVLTNPSSVTLGDDNWSGAINMGFTFSYYGSNYTQCVIGSNGVISFNLGNAGGYCPWSLTAGQTIPNSGIVGANNSSMICYGDLYPTGATSGPVQYQTLGTAPNRKFVVLYNGVTMYSCTSQCVYAGYVFYEGTNVIEHFIGSKTVCSTWNSGLAIQGNQNAPGNAAVPVAGRNNTVWTANQDGRRFTPTTAANTSNYTVAQIPYQNINAPGGNLAWANSVGQTFPYNGGVLQINQVLPGTTGYWLTGTSCGVGVGAVSDTTWITRIAVNGTATATTDYCSGGNGTATVTTTAGTSPFSFVWNPSGQTTPIATNLVAGPYTVTITDANGCSKVVNVTVPNSTATFAATSTLVSCPGGSDGTATATMTPALGTISYNWYDAGGQTTATATGLSAGTYNCQVSSSTGCMDTVQVTVTEIPPMIGQIVMQQDASCNSLNDGIIAVSISGGTPQYNYMWNNSASTLPIANDLLAGTHIVTITDANNCVITMTATIGEPSPLQITSLSPDQIICPENSTMLHVQGTGGSSAYTFTWSENGTVIGVGDSIQVDPSATNTTYCVVLSEACGSPTTDSCMTLNFPTPIVPSFISDKPSSCVPGIFTYTNTSNNLGEIASVLLEYGDQSDELIAGSASATHEYVDAGVYTLTATVTSIYDCVYSGSFPSIVTVIDNPVAEFNMSANPTTIFETTVGMQDKSSGGAVAWQWISPGSIPSASTSANPTFDFPDGVVASYPIQLIVTTAEGCVDTVEHILFVNSDILFFAPNAFTPDGDEFNQHWSFSVSGVDEYNFELLIFNRWGEIIWETHDINASWDGTYHGVLVPQGAYSWIARVKDIYTDKKKEFNGAINVLR
jgi:gliding motility-associated-like protein